ncbi:hypothetical protein P4O66_009653 [Electrophorus voltai]|uniref:IF rod domain-containing protein n=1 Tax=Electrophorus voltai TaxID=2609070 RepID=A0AAD8ZCJ7_9TELE|nr:hypothetical protein P4O66_009653 [Electrophorus voltai]
MTEVTVTKSLLAPLTLEMDPNIQAIKRQEKEQLKILNSVTKDFDEASLGTASMEATLESMIDEIDFLKQIYNEELQELQGHIKDTSVIVEMDNRRHLDMDTIVAEVCAQYEDIANRSRAEAESRYQQKCSSEKDQIKEAEEKGELAMKQAKDSSQEVESALQRTKKDMALQVRKYQSLMNIKLALDIEIATYKKLLEGEENR